MAIEKENFYIIDVLVKAGANVNAKGEKYIQQFPKVNTTITGTSGQTALVLAAERRMWSTVQILVGHRAHENAKGKKYVRYSR